MATKRSDALTTVSEGQISLFGVRETPDAFRKAVQVVHSRPKSPLSLLQRKLGNAWLKHAVEQPADPEGWWELGIKNLAVTIGFDSNNRQYLKEAAEALMRIVHEWDVLAPANKRVQWKASVLFPEVEIRSDVIRYQISSQMRERLVDPEIYAMIDMNVVRRFRRAPSLAIWEFCVRFEKIGRTAEVDWEKFRDMVLGESAEGKTYQEYKYFKSKVLNPAIAEINSESNHTVRLFESRIGKRIAGLRFEVARKTVVEAVLEDDRQLELLGELARLGVPQSEARRLAKEYSTAEIKAAIEYTRQRVNDRKLAPLGKPAAYFRQALVNRYAAASEVKAPSPAPENPAGPSKAIDLRQAFELQRIGEAERYFGDLDLADQSVLIERYNVQQPAAQLKVKKKASRLTQTAFYRWLAIDTWGEPTLNELLTFAQRLLSGQAQGSR